MDISGSHRIPAPRASVWAGLHDPDVLKDCIPGATSVTKTSDDAYDLVVVAKVGPIRTSFSGTVTVSDAVEGERLTITAQGADATAGAAKGAGDVTLADEDGATIVTWVGSADVDGKVAQLGPRLVSGFARQSIDAFFTRLGERLGDGSVVAAHATAPAPEPEPPVTDAPPLAYEEPAPATEAPTTDAPPLAAGTADATPAEPTPIAPTAVPNVPDPVAIAAEAEASGKSATGRIMLVAAIVVVAGVAAYWAFFMQPPV